MAKNFLPFQRREVVNVPPKRAGRVLTGGFTVSNLARMATGGTMRAIVQDIIVYPTDLQLRYPAGGDSPFIRMRVGVDGRNYMTEDLFDYRVFADQPHPFKAIWDWSCGKRTPYRIYPGQKMTVMMQVSHPTVQQLSGVPISVMFNGLKVAHGSEIGTKQGEPYLLHGTLMPPANNFGSPDLIMIDTPWLRCPKDAPVDLYSVTVPECDLTGSNPQVVYILDANERPFWDSPLFDHMIDPLASACSFGYGGTKLDPDETIRVELENGDPTYTDDIQMTITYRGVLEVNDGR